MNNEPLSITEAVRAVLLAAIALPQTFGLFSLSSEQNAAILGLFTAVSLLLTVFARRRSTPTSQVALTHADISALRENQP